MAVLRVLYRPSSGIVHTSRRRRRTYFRTGVVGAANNAAIASIGMHTGIGMTGSAR